MDKKSNIIEFEADTVINALGVKVDTDKVRELSDAAPVTYQIGAAATALKIF